MMGHDGPIPTNGGFPDADGLCVSFEDVRALGLKYSCASLRIDRVCSAQASTLRS